MDEAGRGPWAGPVVAAAVILPPRVHLPGLNDSKKLTEEKRETLFLLIQKKAAFGIGQASNKEVDRYGLLRATELAFRRALARLPIKPDHLLIDGRDKFTFTVPHTSIIKGDEKERSISAASILAKVTRDHLMAKKAKKFPGYHFERHKGYGTEKHRQALKKHGITPLHRQSFEPVKVFI